MTETEQTQPKTAAGASNPASAAAADAPAADFPAFHPQTLRRRMVWAIIWSFVAAMGLMVMRFFFPRTLFEPPTVFTVGVPDDFGYGVDTRFQQAYRIWVVRKPERLFVIYARCTHLGCTPDWKESENKFKCPCHGSGYDNEGINFEGPAPRPMDRAHVELNPQGQIVVDVIRLFRCERGKHCEFDDPGSFLAV